MPGDAAGVQPGRFGQHPLVEGIQKTYEPAPIQPTRSVRSFVGASAPNGSPLGRVACGPGAIQGPRVFRLGVGGVLGLSDLSHPARASEWPPSVPHVSVPPRAWDPEETAHDGDPHQSAPGRADRAWAAHADVDPIQVFPEATLGTDRAIHHVYTIGAGSKPGGPVIGDHVYIGCHSCILGPVRVGDGASIGAGAGRPRRARQAGRRKV
jgi:hypothetical protein